MGKDIFSIRSAQLRAWTPQSWPCFCADPMIGAPFPFTALACEARAEVHYLFGGEYNWKRGPCHGRKYLDWRNQHVAFWGKRVRSQRGAISPFSTAQAAICARVVKPNFPRILLTCTSAVRSLSTRQVAISR